MLEPVGSAFPFDHFYNEMFVKSIDFGDGGSALPTHHLIHELFEESIHFGDGGVCVSKRQVV